MQLPEVHVLLEVRGRLIEGVPVEGEHPEVVQGTVRDDPPSGHAEGMPELDAGIRNAPRGDVVDRALEHRFRRRRVRRQSVHGGERLDAQRRGRRVRALRKHPEHAPVGLHRVRPPGGGLEREAHLVPCLGRVLTAAEGREILVVRVGRRGRPRAPHRLGAAEQREAPQRGVGVLRQQILEGRDRRVEAARGRRGDALVVLGVVREHRQRLRRLGKRRGRVVVPALH